MTKLKSHDLMFLKSVHARYTMQREYEEAYESAFEKAKSDYAEREEDVYGLEPEPVPPLKVIQ